MNNAIKLKTRIISYWWRFILISLLFQSCAKYKEFEAIFPPENNALSNYSKIVIDNPKSGDHLHQMLENAIKTQLTSIHPGNIKPAKETNQLEKEIALFNYNPKIESLGASKIATLSFSIKSRKTVKRDRTLSRVVLKSCNNMTTIPICLPTGTASLKSGTQTVRITLTGSISLKNSQGQAIVAEFPINESLTDSGRLVDSSGMLLHRGINNVAYNFTKRIVPYRERIKSEILRGGDAVAVKLIENNALNLAVNRLDKLISSESDPDVEDVYNLGLAYEALTEIQQALEFYQKANDIDSDQEVVKIALKRVRRIVRN
jgi:tetratricopeptide (TPR) repeat protein